MRHGLLAFATAALITTTAAAKGADPVAGKEGPAPAASAKGPLDKDVLRRVIRGHLAEVRRCYEPELARSPRLAGRVLVGFTVTAEGKVSDSRIEESTLGNAAVERCIVEAVRGWDFPKAKGSTVVSYPFLLASAEPPA